MYQYGIGTKHDSWQGGILVDVHTPNASQYKQFKSGIASKDVVCKQGLELVMKKSSGEPICVKGTSMDTLTLRNYIPEYAGFGGEIPTKLP